MDGYFKMPHNSKIYESFRHPKPETIFSTIRFKIAYTKKRKFPAPEKLSPIQIWLSIILMPVIQKMNCLYSPLTAHHSLVHQHLIYKHPALITFALVPGRKLDNRCYHQLKIFYRRRFEPAFKTFGVG